MKIAIAGASGLVGSALIPWDQKGLKVSNSSCFIEIAGRQEAVKKPVRRCTEANHRLLIEDRMSPRNELASLPRRFPDEAFSVRRSLDLTSDPSVGSSNAP